MTSTPAKSVELTARDAMTYLLGADAFLHKRLVRFAADPTNIEKRDLVLQQIDSISLWLTVMRRAVCDGRLGL